MPMADKTSMYSSMLAST